MTTLQCCIREIFALTLDDDLCSARLSPQQDLRWPKRTIQLPFF